MFKEKKEGKDEEYVKQTVDKIADYLSPEKVKEIIYKEKETLPAKKTREELLADISSTRTSVGKSTLLYRQVRLNTDLAVIAIIVAVAGFAGFSIKDFQWSSFSNYIEAVLGILATVIAVIWKLHTPPGKLSKACISRGQKAEDEVDQWGRSIMAKK